MSDILDYFPKQFTPREVQKESLLAIQDAWNKYDVIVIPLSVGSGKSYIAKTILDWQGQGVITTPNNILVDQYINDFPKLAKIYGKGNYPCSEKGYSSCESRIDNYKRARAKQVTCKNCPWFKDNKRIRSPWVKKYITNNHLYAQMQKYSPILIADEAHNLIDFLQSWHSSRIDYDKYRYPRTSNSRISRTDLKEWLLNMKGIDDIIKAPSKGQKAIRELYYELTSSTPRYILKEEFEERVSDSGKTYIKFYLRLCPLDIRGLPNILWPSNRVRKIILMSATIGPKDIEELGLGQSRVKYIDALNPIPAANRPVIFDPCGAVRGRNLREFITSLSKKIGNISDNNPSYKGLIHATYAQANLLRKHLTSDRFIFHDINNKKQVYADFKSAKDNRILVASGMYEGVDLPYDQGRFQVIAKVPWPNLGEPAISYRSNKDKTWLPWQATKTVLQACGRICRSPDDYGETYILDSTFKRLYNNNPELYPEWFKKSVRGL